MVRGSARRVSREPKRICIIQIAQLGDMVCTTPMFHAVKRAYPNAQVFVVGKSINKEVLQGNGDVDLFIPWSTNFFTLLRTIRTLRCDFAVTTSPNFFGLAALFLAGVPAIAVPQIVGGETLLETRSYRLLRRFVFAIPHMFNAYAPREYLKLLGPIGVVSEDTKKYLSYTPEDFETAVRKLTTSRIGMRAFAIIAPGAGHPLKRWPAERFAMVAEHIAQNHMPVAVIGSGSDAVDIKILFDHVTHPDVVSFCGELPIPVLKAFVAKASLFVSADTGPLYVAEAFGVPTIDIVGPASDTAQPPRGPHNVVIAPTREKPTMTIFSTQCVDLVETKRQAEATTVVEVTKAVDTLIIETRGSSKK